LEKNFLPNNANFKGYCKINLRRVINMAEENIQQEVVQEQPAVDAAPEPQVAPEPKPEVAPDDVKGSVKEDVPEVKTYTEEEVAKMIQSQTDKRVTDALKTAKDKWKAEYEENLAKEKAEAERLAKLSAEERQKEELKKIQEGIDIERAEFEQQRAEFRRERMMLDTVKQLSANGMPTEFADFLVGKNEEATAKNLEAFTAQWQSSLQASIEKHVENRLRGQEPQATNTNHEGRLMSRKEFANLPTKERMQMMKDDPELVQKILANK